MHPHVFETEWFSLRWYNLMIMLGIVAGIWMAQRRAAHKGRAYQDMLLDLALYLVLGAVAGGRIWEMIFTWESYGDDLGARLAIWNGGMSIQGAVLGGLIVALVFAWRRKIRPWELLDILAPGVILGQGIGRIGCLMNGDAFGRPISEVPWLPQWLGVVYAEGTPAWFVFGQTPLVPAEGFEMVLDFAILAILLWYKPQREVAGRIALVYGFLYSLARFLLEFLRADSLTFAGLKVAQLLSVVVMAVCAALLAARYRANQSPTAHVEG